MLCLPALHLSLRRRPSHSFFLGCSRRTRLCLHIFAALHRDCALSASGKRPVPAKLVFSVGFGICIVADLIQRPAAPSEKRQTSICKTSPTITPLFERGFEVRTKLICFRGYGQVYGKRQTRIACDRHDNGKIPCADVAAAFVIERE
jgi:hypothetical protein